MHMLQIAFYCILNRAAIYEIYMDELKNGSAKGYAGSGASKRIFEQTPFRQFEISTKRAKRFLPDASGT